MLDCSYFFEASCYSKRSKLAKSYLKRKKKNKKQKTIFFCMVSLQLEALPVKDQPDLTYKIILTLNAATKAASALFDKDLAYGKYEYDPKIGILSVVFDGLNGPGSSGGWNNESLKIFMSETQYTVLQKTKSMRVVFRSRKFFDAPLAATLSYVQKEIKT